MEEMWHGYEFKALVNGDWGIVVRGRALNQPRQRAATEFRLGPCGRGSAPNDSVSTSDMLYLGAPMVLGASVSKTPRSGS